MTILACDPGAAGGWAWEFNDEVYVQKMQSTPKDIVEFLRNLAQKTDGYSPLITYIEKVGSYVSGNSATAAVKFARHVGNIEAFLIALSIPYHEILPAIWQKFLIGAPNYKKIPKEISTKERKRILAKRKTERKNKIKQNVQARFPHLKITLATSDALGILCFAQDQI